MKSFHHIILTLLAGLFIGCEAKKEPKALQVSEDFVEINDAYHFYVLGDWGRNGQYGQQELADMMNEAAKKVEPEFIISTGDNFYNNGIASVQDPYWISSYENVYNGTHLFCDWYVILGNHDYRGNIQAQIDYSQISRRWNMPDRYYLKDITTDDGATARFVFIDTSPLEDEYHRKAKYHQVLTQDTTAQLQWMDSVLNVDVDWKIVVGHHPLYTGGKRKDDTSYVRPHVEPLLSKHNVDMYLAGHEHDLQHIKPDGKPTHHIVSGAGSEVRPTGTMEYTKFAEAIQGFVSAAINKDSVYCQFVNLKGEMIYDFSIKPN
ncbi:MAG: metallophosphoesterase [Bacteroidota bacterium]